MREKKNPNKVTNSSFKGDLKGVQQRSFLACVTFQGWKATSPLMEGKICLLIQQNLCGQFARHLHPWPRRKKKENPGPSDGKYHLPGVTWGDAMMPFEVSLRPAASSLLLGPVPCRGRGKRSRGVSSTAAGSQRARGTPGASTVLALGRLKCCQVSERSPADTGQPEPCSCYLKS